LTQDEVVPRTALEEALRRTLSSPDVHLLPVSPGRRAIVYRAETARGSFYVRVAEEPGQDLTTDAIVLDRARSVGASVPQVILVERDPPEMDRSFLVTAELPGKALASAGDGRMAEAAVRKAGRDVAVINCIEVQGFGWLVRDGGPVLRAEFDRYEDFVVSQLPDSWPGWLERIFQTSELEALEQTVWEELEAPSEDARLVHGDLDVTHIFIDGDRYAGLIDFGEVRGADRCFDLGHFLLHDQETRRDSLFEAFLSGYLEVRDLPTDHRLRIQRSAILSGLRQLSLWLSPDRSGDPNDFLARFRRAQLLNLIENKAPATPRTEP
jgi:Ser/Thr protein kinase RdoA (MazF antagonist)